MVKVAIHPPFPPVLEMWRDHMKTVGAMGREMIWDKKNFILMPKM
jgi:hypothetical protein